MPKFEMPKFEMPQFDLPAEVARPLYAGVGATDAVVGYVRDAVADLQKRLSDLDLEPQALRETLAKDAQGRREAIEKRMTELQADASAAYADLARRGETLVDRIRTQQSTTEAAAAAQTTATKARTTRTQAAKAAKTTTKAPRSSAKATATAAKKTAAKSTKAATDAATKVGD